MYIIRYVLSTITVALCMITQGHAAVVTYDFVGTITDGGIVGGLAGATGETISGEFSYDTSAFSDPLFMSVPPIIITMTSGSLIAEGTTSIPLYSSDSIGIVGGLQDPISSQHNIDIDIEFTGLLDSSKHPANSFPQSIALGDYTTATGAFSSFSLALGPLGDPIFFSIDTLTVRAIPIPATIWLFGSGLLGLIEISRRKKAT